MGHWVGEQHCASNGWTGALYQHWGARDGEAHGRVEAVCLQGWGEVGSKGGHYGEALEAAVFIAVEHADELLHTCAQGLWLR